MAGDGGCKVRGKTNLNSRIRFSLENNSREFIRRNGNRWFRHLNFNVKPQNLLNAIKFILFMKTFLTLKINEKTKKKNKKSNAFRKRFKRNVASQ